LTYEKLGQDLRKLKKILGTFENRAPGPQPALVGRVVTKKASGVKSVYLLTFSAPFL